MRPGSASVWVLLAASVLLSASSVRSPRTTGDTVRANELVWVVKSNRGTVAVIDPASNRVIDEVGPRVGVTGQDRYGSIHQPIR
jgi:hypothetical protein